MSTAAIIPVFNGFEWGGMPNPSELTFDSILSEFEQDPVFLDPLYEVPGYYLSPISPIPNIPLTHLPPNPSSSELCKTGKALSCITNSFIGDDDLRVRSGQVPQSKNSNKKPDSSWVDMNRAKVLPQALTAGPLERNDSTKRNEESTMGLEKTLPEVKMRSATRRPKRVHKKPALPAHIVQARECHNNVEKQYRTRLKLRFERLLALLEASKMKGESGGEKDSEAPDGGYSGGEVLDFARQRILTLEEENRHLSAWIQNLERGFTTE